MNITKDPPLERLAGASSAARNTTTVADGGAAKTSRFTGGAHPPTVKAVSPQFTDVKTHFDPMNNTLVASIVDKDTGSIVTEMPPEALRDLAYRTAEFRGRLFDSKI